MNIEAGPSKRKAFEAFDQDNEVNDLLDEVEFTPDNDFDCSFQSSSVLIEQPTKSVKKNILLNFLNLKLILS